MRTKLLFTTLLILALEYSCSTVPLTGRKQVNLLPESEMIAMGFSSYSEFKTGNQISPMRQQELMVKEVGAKLAGAVETYFRDNNLSSRLAGYEWEFNLFADSTPNAWAMPGGKIAVYEGILPYTLNSDGMAVVLGHEIAHIVARHGNERMSHQLVVQLGGMALSEAISEKPEETRNIFLSVYGLGAQVGAILPYSRQHELEADRLGLIFMAMAGYDPTTAIQFWERMSAGGGSAPPEFLSTHPSDGARIEAMKKNLPEAMKYLDK